jgi:2C-methyl-D-erythritol 2,4-cyclodiphosphate synthase
LAAAPLELPVSVGDVVAYCIAEDVLKGFGFGDVGTGFTDYSNKFTLVVNASSFLG